MPLVQLYKARRIWKARQKVYLPEAALKDSYKIAAEHETKFIRSFMKVARDMITPEVEAEFLKEWRAGSVSRALNTLPYFDDDPAEGAVAVFNDKLESAYLDVVQAAGDEATDALNKQFGVKLKFSALPPSDAKVTIIQKARADVSVGVNPYSLKWVKQNGLDLAKQMTKTQKKMVNAIIGDAMEQGIRPTDMIAQIKSNIGLTDRQAGAAMKRKQLHLDAGMAEERAVALTSKYQAKMLGQRATMIARTETIRAQAQGRLDAWIVAEESGGLPSVEREWVTQPPSANPNSPCEICLNLNGMKTTLKGTYDSDVGPLVGPPAHPGCVCTEILGRAPK